MPVDAGFILLLANCIVLAGTFIYAYLKPKEWNDWLVASFRTYFVTYFFSTFVIFLIIAFFKKLRELDFLSFPLILFWLVVSLWGIKRSLGESGSKSLAPFLLYIVFIGQQIFRALFSPDPSTALGNLALIYFLGVFAIYFGGRALGYALRMLSPSLYEEHLDLMQERGSLTLSVSPSDFVGMGIIYCIWMVASVFIPQLPVGG